MSQKEQIAEILEKIESGITSVYESEQWKKYLKTMSQFHQYSISNSLLIYLQKPDATYVAGFQTWKNRFNRSVKRGEKAIRILAPLKRSIENEADEKESIITGFRSASVFDISQTKGDPLPEYMEKELKGDVKDYERFIRALHLASPVPLSFSEIRSTANGFYDPFEKKIMIRNDLSEVMTIKTCVHEIAHAILHAKENGRNLSKSQKETEAESVAYAVCAYYGIDTKEYSFPYIAGWSKTRSAKELKESLDHIHFAADQIITTLKTLQA